MPLHRTIKDQGIENFSFEVIKTVDYIDTYHLLIIESCCMDEYDSINNGYNTKHSVCMFDFIRLFIIFTILILYCSL